MKRPLTGGAAPLVDFLLVGATKSRIRAHPAVQRGSLVRQPGPTRYRCEETAWNAFTKPASVRLGTDFFHCSIVFKKEFKRSNRVIVECCGYLIAAGELWDFLCVGRNFNSPDRI